MSSVRGAKILAVVAFGLSEHGSGFFLMTLAVDVAGCGAVLGFPSPFTSK